jgi:hypothetical protein
MIHRSTPTRDAGPAIPYLLGNRGIVAATFVLFVVSCFATGFGVRHGYKGLLLAINSVETVGVVESRVKTRLTIGSDESSSGERPVYKTTFSFTDSKGAAQSGACYSTRGPDVPSVYEGTKIPLGEIENFAAKHVGDTLCTVEYFPLLPTVSRIRGYNATPIGRGTLLFAAVFAGILLWVISAIRKALGVKTLLEHGVLTTGTLLQILVIKAKNHRTWHSPANFAANPPAFFRDGSTLSYQVAFSTGGQGEIIHQATAPLTMAMLQGAPITVLYDPQMPTHASLLHEISGMPLPDAHGSWTPQEPAAAIRRMALSALLFLGSIFMIFVLPLLLAK